MVDPADETVKEMDPVNKTAGERKDSMVRLKDLEATIEAIVNKALVNLRPSYRPRQRAAVSYSRDPTIISVE